MTLLRNWILLAGCCLLGAGLLLAPTSSDAADFSFEPCGNDLPGPLINPGWQDSNPYSVFWRRTPCGGEWSNRVQIGSWFNVAASSTLELPGDQISSVEMYVTGKDRTDDGVPQSLRFCRGVAEGEICGLPIRGSTALGNRRQFLHLYAGDAYLPIGANHIELSAACTGLDPSLTIDSVIDPETATLCRPSADDPRFEIFYMTAVDNDPPQMSRLEFQPGQWVNSMQGLKVILGDSTSGVKSLELERSGYFGHTTQYVCTSVLSPYVCRSLGGVGVEIPEPTPGANSYVLTAVDAAGNRSSQSFSINYDAVAPGSPISLRADDGAPWIVGDVATLKWKDFPEKLPSDFGSGVTSATVDLVDSSGKRPAGFPMVERGVGIESATLNLPYQGTWTATVRLRDGAGNEGPSASTTFDNQLGAPGPPSIHSPGPVNSVAAAVGLRVEWGTGGLSRSGVCGYRGWIGNGEPPDLSRDPSTSLPGSLDKSWQITPAGLLRLEDGTAKIAIAVVDCAGLVGASETRTVLVDRLPPTATLDTDESWERDPAPIQLVGSDAGAAASGVASVWYSLDAGPTVAIGGVSADLPVFESGLHEIRFGATDAAGNRSLEFVRTIGVDLDPPEAQVESSADDPGRFVATAVDPLSGIVSATFELRGLDGSWLQVGDRFHVQSGQRSPLRLGADIPKSLAEGDYLLRFTAADAAGNSQVMVRNLHLPLTKAAHLDLAIAKAASPNATASAITVHVGQPAILTGRLRDATGGPIANRQLNVVADRDAGGGRRRLAVLTSGPDGRFRLRLGTDVSRSVAVNFAGDQLFSATNRSVRENVRASVSLRLSNSRPRRGTKFVARGRIKLLSASVPGRGIPVRLEFCKRHRCLRFGYSTYSYSDGSYAFRISTRALRRGTYRLRAVVDSPAASWAFADGHSRVERIVVR